MNFIKSATKKAKGTLDTLSGCKVDIRRCKNGFQKEQKWISEGAKMDFRRSKNAWLSLHDAELFCPQIMSSITPMHLYALKSEEIWDIQ